MMLIRLELKNTHVNPVPRMCVRGFETLHLQGVWNNLPRVYARDVRLFDLPVRPIRQAQGGEEDRTTMLRVMVRYSNHEALEGEALDGWFGVKTV